MASVRGAMILDDRMTSVLKSTTQALHMVVDSMSKMNSEMGKTPEMSQLNAAKRQLQNIDREFATIAREVGTADGKQRQFNHSLKTGEQNAGAMASKLKGAAAAAISLAAAGRGLSAFAHFADDMARIEGRLSIINDGRQTTAKLEDMILKKSYESGANYKSMADMVGRFGVSSASAFKNTAEMVDFAGELNKMFVVAGTSAQGIEGATLQMTQAMAKGVLQGQEFNSIMEQAPGVINAIAKHLGVSTGELKQMAEEGKLTAQVVKDSVLEASAETADAFNQIPWTLTGGIANRLKTAATMALKPAAEQFTAMVNSEQFHKAFEGMVRVIYAVGQALLVLVNISSMTMKFMVDHWDAVKSVLKVVAIVAGVHLVWAYGRAALAAVRAGAAMVRAYGKVALAAIRAGASAALSALPVVVALMVVIAVIAAIIYALHEMGVSWEDAGRAAVGAGYATMAVLRNMDRAVYNLCENIRTLFHNAWEKVKESAASALNFMADKANAIFAKLNNKAAKKSGLEFQMLGHIGYKANIAKPNTMAYESIGDAYKKGHDEGFKSMGHKIGNLMEKFTQVKDKASKGLGQSEYDQATPAGDGDGKTPGDRARKDKVDKIADNTDKIKEALKITNEDLSYMRKWEEGRRAALYNVENKIKVETVIDRPDSSFDIDGYARDLGVGLLTQMDITKGGLVPV